MRLVGLNGRSQRPAGMGDKRTTLGGERGTLALEFLIILPFLVGLTWLVQWAGEGGRAALQTSLVAEEAATVAVMARQRGLSPSHALRAAAEYIESRSYLWSLREGHCVNASYDETTGEYDMREAVGGAWWEIGADEFSAYDGLRGGDVQGMAALRSYELLEEPWVDYRIGNEAVKVAIAVVGVRCESRFRFSLPITFSPRTHETVAWEPLIIRSPITSP